MFFQNSPGLCVNLLVTCHQVFERWCNPWFIIFCVCLALRNGRAGCPRKRLAGGTQKTGRGNHHGKPLNGTERRIEERWNGIEQACPSVEARSDQPRRRPRKSA